MATRKLRNWFGVKTLYRTRSVGRATARDAAQDGQATLVEERIVLFRAANAGDAIRQAETEARVYARGTHINPYGQRVVGKYLGACDCFELFEVPGEGREVFSTTELVPKSRNDSSVVRQRLGALESSRRSRLRRNFLNRELSGRVSNDV